MKHEKQLLKKNSYSRFLFNEEKLQKKVSIKSRNQIELIKLQDAVFQLL